MITIHKPKLIVQLTDPAKTHIQNWIQKEEGNALRLSLEKKGCSGYAYVTEVMHEMPDQHSEIVSNDVAFYIDNEHLSIINGVTIDLVTKSLGQKMLTFENTIHKGQCGCGESFHV